ncbi:G1/S-specific cyclin-D1, partial [Blomia tropicalis]
MDLLCSEPSPTSPTEKFFDSEQKQLPTTTNSNSNEMNGGKMDNSNTNGSPESDSISVSVGHKMGSNGLESNRYDLCSSPLSEASSGYGSTLAQSSPEVDDVDMCNFLQIGDDSSHGEMPTRASHDAHMLNDLRIPRQMLQIECQYVPFGVVEGVYLNGKYEADERARTIVTEWMLEVCEELKCEEVTFPLAVNYLDRFLLASPEIRKYQLQLIAVVSLLIASKIRQCQAINPYDLSYMTDNSVEVEQILNWELLVLKRLQWDVSSILAIDYLDHILVNLPELVQNSYDRQHN